MSPTWQINNDTGKYVSKWELEVWLQKDKNSGNEMQELVKQWESNQDLKLT